MNQMDLYMLIYGIPTLPIILSWAASIRMLRALRWSWGYVIIALFCLWALGEMVWVLTWKIMLAKGF